MADPDAAVSDEAAIKPDAVVYVYLARALRDFGDGFVAVLLPVYLIALGFSPLQVGLIATIALLGSALLTLGVGLIGARYDHRRLLLAAANLMVATGRGFRVGARFRAAALIALAGTVNPSAGSVSVFVPLEHAVLSREVADHDRTRMFARYSLIGAMAGACGALAAAAPDFLSPFGLTQLDGHQDHVRRLCRVGSRGRMGLFAHPAAAATRRRASAGRARAVAAHRLQAGGIVQPRRFRRRLRRAIAAGAVAV